MNELKKGNTSELSTKLLTALNNNGASIKPLYSINDNEAFEKYFVVETIDDVSTSRLLDELWKSGAIESAYIKPNDAPPMGN